MNNIFLLVAGIICLLLVVAGCGNAPVNSEDDRNEPSVTTEVEATITEAPVLPTATATDAKPAPLSMEPQEVTFTNAAGVSITGLYYPAAVNPAPLGVLMHWSNGDMSDWYEVAACCKTAA
ncbi:hypothetical protein EG834_19090 [bacterium]|nr:hypothetical protein [bacterium]